MEKACPNCFSAVDFSEQICPHCNYDFTLTNTHSYALIGGILLNGRYITGKVIGTGGFGITYLAYDIQHETAVAVKEYYPHGVAVRAEDNITLEPLGVMNTEHYQNGLEKFVREGTYMAQFSNSSEVVSIHDIFEENGTAYYVMDFLNGMTLKEYTDKHGRITEQQAVFIAEKIALAFKVIHSGGIIHRDVSPDNIMLCRNGNVRLIDFGAARPYIDINSELSIIMKHGFTPLEQYQKNGKQGAWTDIYSLGASLYYALTMNTPEDPITRLDDDSVFEEDTAGLSDGITKILSHCCEIRKKDRYQSAEELLSALSDCGISACGFDEKKLRHREMYLPKTELSYLKKAMVRHVKIAGEMVPVDIEELNLSDRELTIAQIGNLRHLKNLKRLYVQNNYLTDLSVISGLTELTQICFDNNDIDSIEFARNMDKLDFISGNNTFVSDLSSLKNKSELRGVYFGDTYVTDISPIKNCNKLVYVGFDEMQIGTIEALRDKPLLRQVCLSGCKLTDISPLKTCPSLKEVYIGRNKLTDLSPLKGLELEQLSFDNNRLCENIESLEGITVKYDVAAEINGFTKEQARRVTTLIKGGTFYFEKSLGDIWQD